MSVDDGTDEVVARVPLSRRRVLRAAMVLVDHEGLDVLTMRRLAGEVDVEAMSLYHHVANKEAVLDGLVDLVMEEVVVEAGALEQDPDGDWQATMRARILAARRVLVRHAWAPRVFETRVEMNLAVMSWFESLLGIFRAGGFSYDLAHRAMHALGSMALGFTQELFAPDDADAADEDTAAMMAQFAEHFPHMVAMVADAVHDQPDTSLGWCDDQFEFEFALDLVLDGLERHRQAQVA